jgi:pimeloyl-ACP methyl ester carboxylesterase
VTAEEETGRLEGASGGGALAYARLPGAGPAVVFLGGFRSDMQGSKALALRDWCAARGREFLRFDYAGHGASDGDFEAGSIGAWAADAALVLERLVRAPGAVLVGSSMGGWIALLLALRQPARVRGLLGIAAAPDFTEALMWPAFSEAQRAELMARGVLHLPSQYGPPTPITRTLIEDGRRQLVMAGGAPVPLAVPVRLLQGMADPDVPWRHALRLMEALAGTDAQLTLVKDGDHRLSRPQDLALLTRVLEALLQDLPAEAG